MNHQLSTSQAATVRLVVYSGRTWNITSSLGDYLEIFSIHLSGSKDNNSNKLH